MNPNNPQIPEHILNPPKRNSLAGFVKTIDWRVDNELHSLRGRINSIQQKNPTSTDEVYVAAQTILHGAKDALLKGSCQALSTMLAYMNASDLNQEALRQATSDKVHWLLNEVQTDVVNNPLITQAARNHPPIEQALRQSIVAFTVIIAQTNHYFGHTMPEFRRQGRSEIAEPFGRLEAEAADTSRELHPPLMVPAALRPPAAPVGGQGASIAAATGTATAASTSPDDVVAKLSQDPVGIAQAARALANSFAEEVDRLKRSRPNEPDQLAQHDDLVATYENMQLGLSGIADALEQSVATGSPGRPEPVCLGIAAKIVRQLQTGLFGYLGKYRNAVWVAPINLCLFGAGITFLNYFGFANAYSIGGLTALLLKYGVPVGSPPTKSPAKERGKRAGRKG